LLDRNPDALRGGLPAAAPPAAVAAALGAGEEPCLSAKCDAAQSAFGRVVAQASATVAEEPGEAVPALEHVVHGLGDRGVARQARALSAQPLLEIGDERRGIPLARGAACLGIGAVDDALQVEDRVDAPHRLQRDG
jgi:hypothetical protein